MSIAKSKNKDFLKKTNMENMILNAACKIQDGSIKIIKQDNIIIQININERIVFNSWPENRNCLEEVAL